MNDWNLARRFTIYWCTNIADSSNVAVCYECLWLIDHSRWMGRILADVGYLRRTQIKSAPNGDVDMPVWRRRENVPPGEILRPLIGCRAAGGGSGGHTERAREIGAVDMTAGEVWTAYKKQDLSASQLVAAVPMTGSLVCNCWLNHWNTTGTVGLPRRPKSGNTDWINWTAGDCNMDADSSLVDNREGNTFGRNRLVPWEVPESVVDITVTRQSHDNCTKSPFHLGIRAFRMTCCCLVSWDWVQFRDTPDQIAPRLTEQDPLMAAGAVVFDCRPALLPVSVDLSGIDMRASRSAICSAESVFVPPEFGGGGRICVTILIRSWLLMNSWTMARIWRTSCRRRMVRQWL